MIKAEIVLPKDSIPPPHVKIYEDAHPNHVVIIWSPTEVEHLAYDLMSFSHKLRREINKL